MTVALRTARTRGLFVVAIVLTMLASAAPANAAISEKFWFQGCIFEMKETSSIAQPRNQVRDVNGRCHYLRSYLRYVDLRGRQWERKSSWTTGSSVEVRAHVYSDHESARAAVSSRFTGNFTWLGWRW